MAIFTNNKTVSNAIVTENGDVDAIFDIAQDSADILYEFNMGLHKAETAMYVADIMIETAVNEGATDVQVLVESSVKELAANARKWFEKLFEKIRVWFKRAYINFTNTTKSISDFVSKNEIQIFSKFEKLGTYEFETVPLADTKTLSDKSKETLSNLFKLTNISDMVDAESKIDSITTEVKNWFNKEGYTGESAIAKKVVISNKSALTKYVKECKDSMTKLNFLKSNEKALTDAVKDAISSLKKIESANDEDASTVNMQIRVNRKLITAMQSLNNMYFSLFIRTINKKYSVCRGIMSKRTKEEKTVTATADNLNTSIFEAALTTL